MYRTYEETYNLVPMMLHHIVKANPATYINKLDIINPYGGPNCYILDCIFWAFSQVIKGFKFCHPVLIMGDIFLTGRYKSTIVTALVADANDLLLPAGFAIIENKNTDGWL